MYKKVLVPFDQSEPACHALQQALELTAGVPDAEIIVLNVMDWHEYNAETFKIAARMSYVMDESIDMVELSDVDDETVKEVTDRVSAAIADIVGDAERVSIAIVNGSPHEAITLFADAHDLDCIVMGHRGLGAVRGMLGSVCYSVLHKTNEPVLIVK